MTSMAINVGKEKTAVHSIGTDKTLPLRVGTQVVYPLKKQSYPCLGFVLDKMLSATPHVTHRFNSANRWIKDSNINSPMLLGSVDYIQRARCVVAFVRPKFAYGCMLIDPSSSNLSKMAQKERGIIYGASHRSLRIHTHTVHDMSPSGIKLIPFQRHLDFCLLGYLHDLHNRPKTLIYEFVKHLSINHPSSSLFYSRISKLPLRLMLDRFPDSIVCITDHTNTILDRDSIRKVILNLHHDKNASEAEEHSQKGSLSHIVINQYCKGSHSDLFH